MSAKGWVLRPLSFAHRRLRALKSNKDYLLDFYRFRKMSARKPERLPLRWKDRLPCLNDRDGSLSIDRHYIYHTAWAARALAEIRPQRHMDISSMLFFCSIISAFVPVQYYEYRKIDLQLDDLTCGSADLLALPFPDNSVSSLSCMHVVEHIGLGRYGDRLDVDGDLKAMSELKRVLSPGGSLLFVVPVGRPRIMFNGHRIYAHEQILEHFDGLRLREFALIPDNPSNGGLIPRASAELVSQQSYGCGCYWFMKNETDC
jgi:SAM-dependent methyltransferase